MIGDHRGCESCRPIPLRLEQALGNLVDNALVHGGGVVTLRASRQRCSRAARRRTKGRGFPPGVLGPAFDRFSRADEARSGGGTGLGLAIVALIARAHGGEAHIESWADGGADVWLSLATLLS